MIEISSIRALIDAWPSRAALASEIDVSTARVHKWAKHGAIPARFHARILRAAVPRGFAVTAEDLVRLHDRPEADEAA